MARRIRDRFLDILVHWTTPHEDPVAPEGADFSVAFIPSDDDVELRVFRWIPRERNDEAPLVFVAGWVSAVEGWADMIAEAARDRDLYYIESREKQSAKIAATRLGPSDFCVRRLADDLVTVCDEIGLGDGRTAIVGSSLGATAIIEAPKRGRLNASAAFVIGPNAHFVFPWWAKVLPELPAFTYHFSKWIALFYLKYFRVDSKREPQQIDRYIRTLRTADPLRMKLSAQAVQGYEIWSGLDSIEIPVAVACSPTDGLHREEDVKRIVDEIPKCELVSCPTNHYMHCADIVTDIRRFLEASNGGGS